MIAPAQYMYVPLNNFHKRAWKGVMPSLHLLAITGEGGGGCLPAKTVQISFSQALSVQNILNLWQNCEDQPGENLYPSYAVRIFCLPVKRGEIYNKWLQIFLHKPWIFKKFCTE
jgi:hypothetical protein